LLSIHTGAQGGECMIDEWPEAGKSSLSPFPFMSQLQPGGTQE